MVRNLSGYPTNQELVRHCHVLLAGTGHLVDRFAIFSQRTGQNGGAGCEYSVTQARTNWRSKIGIRPSRSFTDTGCDNAGILCQRRRHDQHPYCSAQPQTTGMRVCDLLATLAEQRCSAWRQIPQAIEN